MRIAYLDCFSGISGDMFLGALVDAGVPFALLQKTVSELNIGASLEQSRVDRGGVSACKVDVMVNGEKDMPREEFWAQRSGLPPQQALSPGPSPSPSDMAEDASTDWFAHGHSHPGERTAGFHRHDHTHTHSHQHTHADGTSHSHEHSHSHSHAHDHGKPHKHERGDLHSHAHHADGAVGEMRIHNHEHEPHWQDNASDRDAHSRKLSEILGIIAAAGISERSKQTASEIFLALGAAEAKVHNVGAEDIHFHEVGAADAIVDIVCAAVGAEALGVEEFVSSPINVGGGTVACAHGVLPVPAPATSELLQGVPTYSGEVQKELATPTGAAIVKVLVSSFGPQPAMTTERTGYGAGTRNFTGSSNVLRISVGETKETQVDLDNPSETYVREEIVILEANLDDLNPQLIGYVVEQALGQGALDVFTTPVHMKKNRPGTLLTVLTRPEDEEQILALLFRESSTLGVRTRREQRFVLPRRHETVATRWGEVRMKIASLNGTVSQYAPEYEDCRRIAVEHHIALKTVMQEAVRIYLDQKNG